MTALDIAFYAPLKPPDHPIASGDRAMARSLMAAIGDAFGNMPVLVSDLRSREPAGDPARQAIIQATADAEIARLRQSLAGRVAVWITYHNYYKAPDLIGPEVAKALAIPYVLIESTRARKRLTGPWAGFARAAERASDAAAAIFYLTERDAVALTRNRPAGQALVHLPPFLPRSDLPAAGDPQPGALLTAAMMRSGDKLASYSLLAETLGHLRHPHWHLRIAGDGAARAQVRAAFAPFAGRVSLLGALDPEKLAREYARACAFVWPGVNEAFGMVYLEAQAAGLPVAAQNRPGVQEVLLGTQSNPPVTGGAPALAARIEALLGDPAAARAEGTAARNAVALNHLLGSATARIAAGIGPLMAGAS